MNQRIHMYSSVSTSKATQNISLQDWLHLIKDPLEYKEIIQDLRHLVDINGKTEEYSKIKKTKLPCVTFNQIFDNGHRRLSKAIGSTGFVYIDIDGLPCEESYKVKAEIFQHPSVIASWLSLSCTGIGALVKINAVNTTNFHYAVEVLSKEFNYLDKAAFKLTQPTILSYDPDILIREDAVPFLWSYSVTQVEEINIPISPITNPDNISLRLEMVLDNYKSDCDYYPDGLPYFKAFWPFEKPGKLKKVTQGQRNSILSSFIHNLVILNPKAEASLIALYANSFNKKYCLPALSYDTVMAIVVSKKNYHKREELYPLGVTMKKYWVNPEIENKVKAFQNCRKKESIEDTLTKILNAYEKLKEEKKKPTQKAIALETKLSIITIKRHWKKVSSTINNLPHVYTR
jgi:hypothetical protein